MLLGGRSPPHGFLVRGFVFLKRPMIFTVRLLATDLNLEPRTRRYLRLRNHLPASYWDWARPVVEAFGDLLKASLRKGIDAARQIAVPAALVQGMILLIAVSYFYLPAARGFFDQLVEFKARVGFPFPFVSMGCIAIFAEFLRRRFVAGPAGGSFLSSAAYGVVVFGILGITTDAFYVLQGRMWGGLSPAAQIPAKVLTDQFVYTIFFANPYQTFLYVWKDCGFDTRRLRERMTPFSRFYAREVLAVLITNWAFWIPTTCILYSLPISLQFVICQMAITVWVLLLNVMTRS